MYTKGEWKIYKGNNNVSERVPPEGRSSLWNIWVVDEDNQAIAQIHSGNDDILKANAHLIAKSPKMYEALMEFPHYVTASNMDADQILDAIRKWRHEYWQPAVEGLA